jgi:putative DNA primase/helicase
MFSDYAPSYWAKGIPVIPLYPKEKRPAISGWQRFATEKPSEEERQIWLSVFPNGNIGLPLGPSAGVVAFDVDTDDAEVLRMLDSILPASPWTRIGKKGYVRLYRFSGEQTTRFRNESGTLCELLSIGSQVVLPPSIHPDTGKPYTANCDLDQVINALPSLPVDWADLIRKGLRSLGHEVGTGAGQKLNSVEYVPAGTRDVQMTAYAGMMARAVIRGERTLAQALAEMDAWVANFVEHVDGDPLDPAKARAKLVEFLVKDVTGDSRFGLPAGWDDGLTENDKNSLGLDFSDEHEQWDFMRFQAELMSIAELPPATKLHERQKALDAVLEKMARSQKKLLPLEEERLITIMLNTKLASTKRAVQQQLKLFRNAEVVGNDHTEIAQAVIKQVSSYNALRAYDGMFWIWTGAYWRKCDNTEILKTIATDFGHLDAARRSNDHKGIQSVMINLLSGARSEQKLNGVNFSNGFLTENLDLLPHTEDLQCTYVLPFPYAPLRQDQDPAEAMPLFSKLLRSAWGHDIDFEAKVQALQEAFGATIFGAATRYQTAFCMFGVGASGKSQILNTLQDLIPAGATSSVPPDDWSDKYLPSMMSGKIMNYAGELSESKSIAGDVFKKIVTGEPMPAQNKFGQPFEFRSRAANWFASNVLPTSKDTSTGFMRRWAFFQFQHAVPEEERIPDLSRIILANERHLIASWAVEGFKRLLTTGSYTKPLSHRRLSDQMANRINPVRYFLSESSDVRRGGECSLEQLYQAFFGFTVAKGVPNRPPRLAFREILQDLTGTFNFRIVEGLREEAIGLTVEGLSIVK